MARRSTMAALGVGISLAAAVMIWHVEAPLAGGQAKPTAAPAQAKPAAPGGGPTLVLDTAKGIIEIDLFPQDAPKSVERILKLVRDGFYRGLRFHWVQPGIVQFGDPTTRNMAVQDTWGKGGSRFGPIGVAEFSKRTFDRGSVGLFFLYNDPKQADSQIFITRANSPNLNGKYTMIGHVTKGLDVVDKIQFADVVKQLSVKGEGPK